MPPRLPITRRHFIRSLSVAGGAAGILAYGHWIEPEWLEVRRERIPFFKSPPPRPLRILLLADFHYSATVPLSLIKRSIELGLAEKPDLVLLAGDFVTERLYDPVPYMAVLKGLTGRIPCLACLGNHDGDVHAETRKRPAVLEPVRHFLKQSGVPVLENQTQPWTHEGRPFEIIGLGDLWSNLCEPEKAFPKEDAGLPRLVLSHNPDSKSLLRNFRWNVMTCGHSHGGQFCLPLLGSPFAPLEDKRYAFGLHEWEGRQIYTTKGVGNLHGIRINCRPEVTILDLV